MKLGNLILATAAFFTIASCEKEADGIHLNDNEQPFSSISFTVGEETAVVDAGDVEGNSILAVFDKVGDFSAVWVDIYLNPGFTVTYPENLNPADFSTANGIAFQNKKGKDLRYFVTFASNACPLYNGKKVRVDEFEAGENVRIDNKEQTLYVEFYKEMDRANVTLAFDEGALVEGFEPQDNLVFDFSSSYEQAISFKNGNEIVEYKLVLDMSSVAPQTLEGMGFADITSEFDAAGEHPYLKVYRTESIASLPVDVLPTSATVNKGWYDDAPSVWGSVSQQWKEINNFSDDAFNLLGDWPKNRWGVSMQHPIVIILLDPDAVVGDIECDAVNGVDIRALNNAVAVTGAPRIYSYHLYKDGTYVKNITTESMQGTGYYGNDKAFRAAVGFDAEGKMSFATMYAEGSPVPAKQIPFIKAGGSVEAAILEATDWNVVSAATNYPYLVRDGYAVKKEDQILNDGPNFSEWDVDPDLHAGDDPADALGYGWRTCYQSRAVIGTTWNGEIGIAVVPRGYEKYKSQLTEEIGPESPYYGYDIVPFGYSLPQLAWILVQLGWKDVFPLGSNTVASADGSAQAYRANVKVLGKMVLSEADDTKAATSLFEAKTVYDNNYGPDKMGGIDVAGMMYNPLTVSGIAPSFCVTFDPKPAN